ncbi:MAG: hypothetical protein LBE36_10470 [Flavobacteriaceae bacterium]|jgi:hypothetical protein|nr:hypothetical protein [Flavobacteriaceae bacterium]
MANNLVKMVAEKANISESIAQVAVDTVLNLLKNKLPAGVGDILDSFLGSDAPVQKSKASKKVTKVAPENDSPFGDLGSIVDTIGDLLGGKK